MNPALEGQAVGDPTECRSKLQMRESDMLYDADPQQIFRHHPPRQADDRLMIALKERIVDKRVLSLISKWLQAPVSEDGQLSGGKTNKVGTPQGGVISPLLSNLYLHLLDRIVNSAQSLFKQTGIAIVRYADDFVLMGKTLGSEALTKLKDLVGRMGLTINEQKSRQLNARETPFNFLGFVFRYDQSHINPQGEKFWNVKANEKSNKKVRDKIGEALKHMGHCAPKILVKELNAILRGWINYLYIKGVSYPFVAKRALNYYLRHRLLRYFNRKSQRKSRLYRKQAFEILVNKFGLIDPIKSSPATLINCERIR